MIFNNDFQIPHKYVIVSVCFKIGNKIFYSTIKFFPSQTPNIFLLLQCIVEFIQFQI